jgi:hypothetical protein
VPQIAVPHATIRPLYAAVAANTTASSSEFSTVTFVTGYAGELIGIS